MIHAWPRPRRRAAFVVGVVVTGVLAGCGGGGDDDAVRSKADFIAAADKICVARDARSKQLARESGTNVGKLTGALADAYAAAISQLAALELPPGADRAGATKYVKSVTALQRPVQRMKAAAKTFADAASVAEIKSAGAELQIDVNAVQAISDLADQNARLYGMKSCGQQQSLPVT